MVRRDEVVNELKGIGCVNLDLLRSEVSKNAFVRKRLLCGGDLAWMNKACMHRADEVINSKTEDIVARVKDITGTQQP